MAALEIYLYCANSNTIKKSMKMYSIFRPEKAMKLARLVILLLCLASLCGCGTYYSGTVDSILSSSYHPLPGDAYYIEPASPDIKRDDLYFRAIADSLAPAFLNRGWFIVDDKSQATHIARLSYYQLEPQSRYVEKTVEQIRPMKDKKGKVIEVTKKKETVSEEITTYKTALLLEGFLLEKNGKETAIWRTEVVTARDSNDMRTMLGEAAGVLQGVLGVPTNGQKKVSVYFDENGQMSVDMY